MSLDCIKNRCMSLNLGGLGFMSITVNESEKKRIMNSL